MTKPFVPQSYKSFRIDGYDIEGGVFHGRYTMCGADSADDVSFAETVDFGDTLGGGRPDDRDDLGRAHGHRPLTPRRMPASTGPSVLLTPRHNG